MPKSKKPSKSAMDRLAKTIGVSVDALRSKLPTPKEKVEDTLRSAIEHEAKGSMIYYIHDDGSGFVEGHGYRAAVVTAGEDGYRWTGEWPNDGTGVMPYFWGPTLRDAKAQADRLNERQGISPEVASIIVARSMARGTKSRKRRGK